jgi:hypothetical protein
VKKLNAEAPGEKQKSVMDTAHFEENRLEESALNRGQWQEAVRNFCAFIEEISDKSQPLVQKMLDHSHIRESEL